jgi:hypothetical protein
LPSLYLDVEEKARAKNAHGKGDGKGDSNANMLQKFQNGKNKAQKNKWLQANMHVKNTTTFKEQKKFSIAEMNCYTCGKLGQLSKDCPDHADFKGKKGQGSKAVNTVTVNNTAKARYGTVLSVTQSSCWWLDTGANVHVCADMSLFFSYQVIRDSSILIGNMSHASVHGVGTIDLTFTSGKIV